MKHRGQFLPPPHVRRKEVPTALPGGVIYVPPGQPLPVISPPTPEPAYRAQAVAQLPEPEPRPYLGPTETPSPTPVIEEVPVPPVKPVRVPKVGDSVLVQYPAGTEPVPGIVVRVGKALRCSVRIFEHSDAPPKLRTNLEPYSEAHPYGWYWPDVN